jgi:hypothetical protein
MKNILSLFILTLMMPQLAFASSTLSLKDVLDNYTFEMTVVWDQKDATFAEQKEAELTAGIEKLMAEGLTKNDVLEATGYDIQPLLVEVSALNLSSSSEIGEFLKTHKQSSSGANWAGEVILGVGFAVILLGVIISKIVQQNKRYDACVAANAGNEQFCIDNPEVLGR